MRKATRLEEKLIAHLIVKSGLVVPEDWASRLYVQSLDDGGMGSLTLFPQGIDTPLNRRMKRCGSEQEFKDSDQVIVLASLYLSEEDELFELDMWKVDFSPLLQWPEEFS